ncbi:MAG: hypothetical protein KC731_12680 [Myxococcales bacterium]|nr:hypothetical protein [Myxococcales bacterium]
MNPAHGNAGTQAGDPVDPASGRVFTIREADLPLTGPLVLALERQYSSSRADLDTGLGFGWSHSFDFSIRRRRRSVVITAPFGKPIVKPLPPGTREVTVRQLGIFRFDDHSVTMAAESGELFRRFERSPQGKGQFRLSEIFDSAGNVIQLQYHDGLLTGFVDSAGRQGRVQRDGAGRIRRFEVSARGQTTWFRSYEHDARGDLVRIREATGHATELGYDEDHRLTQMRVSTGRATHFVYDDVGRCVETWVDWGGAVDPALAPDVPDVLADGQTPAKGILHARLVYEDGATFVFDSKQARRLDFGPHGDLTLGSGLWVETRGYDEHGHVALYGDPLNNTTQYQRDERGRLLAQTDPCGETVSFDYDDQGRLSEAVDALGHAIHYEYDEAGDLLQATDAIGVLLSASYDARGLRQRAEMPNGAVTELEHDAEGNLVAVVEPDGGRRELSVDGLGRVIALQDEMGARTAYQYDAMGRLVAIVLPTGATTSVERDAEGHIVSLRSATGAVWRLHWAGYHSVHRVDLPTGDALHYQYDREGHLVRVVNECGEEHLIERDVAGRVVAERFFDGRHYRYERDATGALTVLLDGNEQRLALTRDPNGRVVERVQDDAAEAFDYDGEGRLVSASNDDVAVRYHYDPRGRLIGEACRLLGEDASFVYERDAVGKLAARRLSSPISEGGRLGPHATGEVRFDRDLMGRATRIHLPGGGVVERTFDLLGREVARELPGGGSVVARYDVMGAMSQRHVLGPNLGAMDAAPEWAGDLPAGATFGEQFETDADGQLLARITSDGVRESFQYDARGRVLERRAEQSSGGGAVLATERYRYAGGGRTFEVDGPERRYGAGGVPMARGSVSYEHDAEGRRTAKIAPEGTTRYEWGPRGLLSRVELPDGTLVAFVYDTDGRRVLKQKRAPGGPLVETRFLWAEGLLVYEATSQLTGEERRLVAERIYVHDDMGAPLAHRDVAHAASGAEAKPWVHYVAGLADMPSLLVSDRGQVVTQIRHDVWGRASFDGTATTPLRYLSQYHDEETGLSYNRYRYYDPELGHYLNADPSGLAGGLAAFEYAKGQPFRWVDPLGLQPVTTTVTSSDGSITSTGHSAQHPDHSSPNGIHPVIHSSMAGSGPYYTYDATSGRGGVGTSYPAGRPPGSCGEPHALSNYMRDWERQHNGGRELNPNDPRDRGKIQECLGSIGSIGSNQQGTGARSPCPNCSQLIANLQARYGAPASSAIQPGTTTTGVPDQIFEPPRENFLGDRRRGYSA